VATEIGSPVWTLGLSPAHNFIHLDLRRDHMTKLETLPTDDDLEAEFAEFLAESRQHDGDTGSWDGISTLPNIERDAMRVAIADHVEAGFRAHGTRP
jgi:hypothetical protein